MLKTTEIQLKVSSERKVQRLIYLKMRVYRNDNSDLMLIEAWGSSNNEPPGIPKLVPVNTIGTIKEDGLLLFDFVSQPVEEEKKDTLTYEIRTVFHLGKMPAHLKGIKVNTTENADIVLINQQQK